MKKVLLSAVALLAFGFANAQEEAKTFGFAQGDIFVEGNLGFSSTNDKNTEVKTNGFQFNPAAGYFVTEKFAVGVELMVGSSKEEVAGTDTEKNSNFGAGVFARYYFLDLGARFKTYAQAGFAFGTEKETVSDYKANGFGMGAGLGIQYFVTPKIAINFGLSDVLSYSSYKADGGKAQTAFTGNVNVFNNFFSTAQFGLTYKL
ncbi:MAG: porin family protein [Flavobacterium sp.]|uniref:outer membrane beta-barrel protein n=1 Tax=Flavobacterium sp. TaxID=239 RepID=UPI0025C71CE1|nr:outer membrane beta-barrel protein [Flavobacterium sp.]MCA1966807.1 porin family protein [Flavobacterium sp.]